MSTSSSSASASGGIGFCGLLTILFIALKLLDHITWSWVWVLAPMWIGWALVLAIFAVCVIAAVLSN